MLEAVVPYSTTRGGELRENINLFLELDFPRKKLSFNI